MIVIVYHVAPGGDNLNITSQVVRPGEILEMWFREAEVMSQSAFLTAISLFNTQLSPPVQGGFNASDSPTPNIPPNTNAYHGGE